MVGEISKRIWDYIRWYLSDGHHILWSSIFKDDTWLRKMIQMKGNPFLFGPELDRIGLPKQHRKPIYMTIHCGDKTTYPDYDFELFQKSLRDHKYDESTMEIKFHGGIILNVSEIKHPEDPLSLDNEWLIRLFSERGSQAVSQYSFYERNKISALIPSHIIAVGGPPYTAEILKYGYAITIPYGKETRHVIFESRQKRHAVEFDTDGSGRLLWIRVRQ